MPSSWAALLVTRRALAVLAVGCLSLSACAYLGTSASPLPSSSAGVASAQPSGESTTSPSPDPTPVDGSVAAGLALIRPVDGMGQVFVIEEDGSARQVSGLGEHASVAVVLPIWSPDRTRIAIRPQWVGSGPHPRLWVVNADGTEQRQLEAVGENISWSPDSSRLLYEDSGLTVDTTGEPQRMWLLDVATGEATVIGRGTSPQWMADGRRISYRPIPDGPVQDVLPFAIMRLPRGEPRKVASAMGAWWSPDGGSLLLQQPDGLHLAAADGTNAHFLVDGHAPVWSPDGTRIVFEYDVTPEEALPIIGVVDLDGNILWSDVVASEPAWSPDGTKLAVEVGFPDASIAILDAATGEVIWELEGSDPAWALETTP